MGNLHNHRSGNDQEETFSNPDSRYSQSAKVTDNLISNKYMTCKY